MDVQVQIAGGNVVFMIVGLPDKAMAESHERVLGADCFGEADRKGE